jgi:hypothetical protein
MCVDAVTKPAIDLFLFELSGKLPPFDYIPMDLGYILRNAITNLNVSRVWCRLAASSSCQTVQLKVFASFSRLDVNKVKRLRQHVFANFGGEAAYNARY